MRALSGVLLAALAAPVFGQYTYYFTDPMQSLQTSDWTTSGTPSFGYYPGGYWGGTGGAMISTVPVPDGTSSYDVRATVHFPNGANNGGDAYLLLRSNSTFAGGLPTNGYAVRFFCLSQYANGSDEIIVYKIVNGTVTIINTSGGLSCSDGMTIRATMSDNGQIVAYVNDVFAAWTQDTSITSGGAPGVILSSSGMVVSQVQLGLADRVPPGPIPTNGLTYAVYPNHIDFQWQPVPDNPNGTGIALYQFLRDDQFQYNTIGYSWSDTTVQPGIEYSYTFIVYDLFFNSITQTVNITVPPLAGAPPTPPDGRRVGVRSTGAYWGAATEQIDVLSGNLNYAVPMLKAQARTGWGVGFNLAYNSQNWRQDSGGIWHLGEDVGYGYGWKLLAGSLTPIWADQYTLYYYSFVDSTGAEYRLTQNNNGIWTSTESIYVTFNANNNTLYFRDGSFWVLNCTSATSEPDSGTMYPTVMEDTNGNQIIVTYRAGAGLSGTNSSARISLVQDVRGTYTFNYNSDSPNHLTSITNNIGTSEAYSFAYSAISLQAPFSPYTGYGSVASLSYVSFTTTSQWYYFGYSSDNSSALTSSALPNGGVLGWGYQNVTYGNGATYREISNRELSKDGVNYTNYPFTYGSSPGYSTNQSTVVDDPGGVGEKYWAFSQTGVNAGMVTQYQGRQLPGPATLTQNDFTWTQDNAGNLYIGSTLTTLDVGKSYQAQKKTDQTVDIYGNVLKVFQYDYNSLSSPARIYTYTYLNSSAYTARYIYNRMTSAILTVGDQNNQTLASNTYDGGTFATAPSGTPNWDAAYASVTARGDVTSYTSINNVGSTTYDQTGNVTTSTQNGITTQVTTNSSTNYAAPSQLSVGGLTSTMDWSPFLGLTGVTGPNGDTSSVAYDPSARPSGSTSPFGAVTTIGYTTGPNSASNPAISTATTNATSGSRWTKTTLDGLGRPITVQTGNSSGTISQTDTVYGSCGCSPTGKMIQQSLPHAPNASPVWTTYTYDGIGRTVSVQAPDGASTTSYGYQGNTVTVTDPAGKWKTFTMDAFGHLTQVVEPNPNSGTSPPQPVSPPTFNPPPGAYSSTVYVTLSTTTSGASIRYTTDGTMPSPTTGTPYSGAITVSSATTTINAIAFESGMANSAITTGIYTIGSGGSGPSWYNTTWGYRKALTIASSKVAGSSNLTNFPVLVSVTDPNLAASALSSGNDILFTAADGLTRLNYEIETFTKSTGLLNAWVQVPSLSTTINTVIYMYYGNSSAPNPLNPSAAWDSNFVGVWHLPNGTTLSANDSTANANNGSISAAGAVSGEIPGTGAASFNGTSSNISVGNASSLNFDGTITMSAWVNVAAFPTENSDPGNSANWAYIIGKGFDGTKEGYFLRLNAQNSSVVQLNAGSDTTGNNQVLWPISGWNTNSWHHVAGTYDGTNWNVYLDGSLKAAATNPVGVDSSSYGAYLGAQNIAGTVTRFFNGDLGEVHISTTARSAGWIATEYNNQSSPGSFVSEGAQQNQGSGSSGTAWSNGYTYRTMALIASGQITGTLTNYPALVSLSSPNLKTAGNGGSIQHTVTQTVGAYSLAVPADFLVTSDAAGTNQICRSRVVESYSATAGTALVWIKVASAAVGSPVYIWYGNASVTGLQGTPAAAWNSTYSGVYHLPNGTALTAADSTSNANHGTLVSAPTAGPGQVGGAAVFNGTNQQVTVPGSGSYTNFTLSVWCNPLDYNYYRALIAGDSSNLAAMQFGGGEYLYYTGGNATVLGTTGTWLQYVLVQSGTSLTVYQNGSVLGSNSSGASYSPTTWHIGYNPGNNAWFNGSLDEVRISSAALSSAWIAADYNNQSAPGTFWTLTYDQSSSGGSGGSYLTPVGMPTFSPAPGTYNSAQSVTISSSTSGATIRYTTNGTTPSETVGAVYTGAITVSGATIKAIAYESGMADSEVASATYTITNSSGGANYTTTYTYDAWDNLNQVSMPRPSGTQTRTFNYYGKLLMSATNPENGTVTYGYNSYNKVATKTDAKGQLVMYSYDSLARLYEVQRYPTGLSGGEDTCQREIYYYDGANPVNGAYAQYAAGRLSAVQYYAPASGYAGSGCGTTFTEQYSYLQAGAKTNKGVLMTRTLYNTHNVPGSYTADLESSYTYDNEGRMTAVQYPGSTYGSAGPNLGYAFDTMGRLNTMTDLAAQSQIITGTTYDPANRLTQINGQYYEGRSYNPMGQLVSLYNNSVNVSYSYSATQNNGKITGQADVSGEQVVYTYDALNRLASATTTAGTSWGQSYTYDGFGNLTDQTVTAGTGTVPNLHVGYNANNQQYLDCADANGNINAMSGFGCSSPYGYDVSNRIVSIPAISTQYAYAPGNKRVWRGAAAGGGVPGLTLDEVTFWSVTGQKLATYNILGDPTVAYTNPAMIVNIATSNYYYGRKMIKNGSGVAYTGSDRLGSIGKYYPWGQEKPSATTNGTEKFTGYFRDAETGLDYSKNRYHQPGMGRFMTPDPYMASGGPSLPGSWNRYAYVLGDPVNGTDHRGLYVECTDSDCSEADDGSCPADVDPADCADDNDDQSDTCPYNTCVNVTASPTPVNTTTTPTPTLPPWIVACVSNLLACTPTSAGPHPPPIPNPPNTAPATGCATAPEWSMWYMQNYNGNGPPARNTSGDTYSNSPLSGGVWSPGVTPRRAGPGSTGGAVVSGNDQAPAGFGTITQYWSEFATCMQISNDLWRQWYRSLKNWANRNTQP